MLKKTDFFPGNIEMSQELPASPGILACYQVGFFQYFEGTKGDILEVTNGCRDQI
jgi:hypothetical protein